MANIKEKSITRQKLFSILSNIIDTSDVFCNSLSTDVVEPNSISLIDSNDNEYINNKDNNININNLNNDDELQLVVKFNNTDIDDAHTWVEKLIIQLKLENNCEIIDEGDFDESSIIAIFIMDDFTNDINSNINSEEDFESVLMENTRTIEYNDKDVDDLISKIENLNQDNDLNDNSSNNNSNNNFKNLNENNNIIFNEENNIDINNSINDININNNEEIIAGEQTESINKQIEVNKNIIIQEADINTKKVDVNTQETDINTQEVNADTEEINIINETNNNNDNNFSNDVSINSNDIVINNNSIDDSINDSNENSTDENIFTEGNSTKEINITEENTVIKNNKKGKYKQFSAEDILNNIDPLTGQIRYSSFINNQDDNINEENIIENNKEESNNTNDNNKDINDNEVRVINVTETTKNLKKTINPTIVTTKKTKTNIKTNINQVSNMPPSQGISLRGISNRVSATSSDGRVISAAAQVREMLDEITSKNNMTTNILTLLQDVANCKKEMRLTYPLLMKVNPNLDFKEQASFNGKKRYNKTIVTYCNQDFYVTNHIFVQNVSKIRSYLESLNLIDKKEDTSTKPEIVDKQKIIQDLINQKVNAISKSTNKAVAESIKNETLKIDNIKVDNIKIGDTKTDIKI